MGQLRGSEVLRATFLLVSLADLQEIVSVFSRYPDFHPAGWIVRAGIVVTLE